MDPDRPLARPPNSRTRLLPLVGSFNFRDLGGYPAAKGRVTRWGRLYRSDTLHELTTEDLETLASLGLASVIDLRTAAEVRRDGRGPLSSTGVRYHNLSVLPEEGYESLGAPDASEGPGARYLWYLEVGAGTLAQALEMLAEKANYPLVFHCMAGKDRTGVLAALVLEACGVERSAIVADYVATEEGLDAIIERLRRHPTHGPRLKDVPRERLAAEASTMEQFLAGLESRYGGIGGWAGRVGLAPGTLERLASLMLEEGAGAP